MISLPKTTPHAHHHFINPPATTSSSFHPCPFIISFRFYPSGLHPRLSALKAAAAASDSGDSLVRKPLVQPEQQLGSEFVKILDEPQNDDNDSGKIKAATAYAYEEVELEEEEEEEKWVDWEDQILEDTVPLVGFVRMILHSGLYESGQRLSPEHETTILEKLLPFHPEHEKKIGCGIDYITIGYHPNFERSRCLFLVRKDGELVDFSYWKCIKGLIRKNYPLYADSFILRHFRKRSPSL